MAGPTRRTVCAVTIEIIVFADNDDDTGMFGAPADLTSRLKWEAGKIHSSLRTGGEVLVVIGGTTLLVGGPAQFWIEPHTFGAFAAKTAFFMLVYIWVRWTLPRFRYDQLMNLGWKVMLPLGLANLVVTALVMAYV